MLKVYSIFDNKADSFSPPFVAVSHGVATRMFSELANDGQSQVSKHPADFKLVCIGTFDEQTGDIGSADLRESLGFASDYVRKEN